MKQECPQLFLNSLQVIFVSTNSFFTYPLMAKWVYEVSLVISYLKLLQFSPREKIL